MADVNGMTFRDGKPHTVTLTVSRGEALALTLLLQGEDNVIPPTESDLLPAILDELLTMVWNSHYYDGAEEALREGF